MKKIFSIILSLCLFGFAYGNAFTTDCGNTVSITATPVTGYHFTQWQDGNTDNPRTITLTQDTIFTAEFAKNLYSVTGVSQIEIQGTVIGRAEKRRRACKLQGLILVPYALGGAWGCYCLTIK